jgi:hypothetical protein
MYERFKRTVNGIDVWYCWLEIDSAHLDEVVPEQAHGHAGLVLLLRDFTLSHQLSLDGLKAVICIGAKLTSYGRSEPVDSDAIAEWQSYLTNYGYDIETDGLDKEQYRAKVLSLDYKEIG